MEIPDGSRMVQAPKIVPPPGVRGTIVIETYHKECVYFGERRTFIYRHEGLPLEEVFERLLANYRPNSGQ